ncbi:hypothetical protein LPB140_05140 [Sphingorhabdus lutea]|uniref:Nudix hydrolase domain-containing protein n=1 Tax=Sphingorhabdus lutea TaxID=1913578 RepID=A0A1L3JAZ1_9SPHN|nr:NUDIX domain-containing protein [Sphingorhabdus lutea]APG62291.1 hypothetical protein LPB140_05140 [Sphingorhabdus lutea]
MTISTLHPKTGEPLPPAIPAATLIIYRDAPHGHQSELLMVVRAQSMAFAGGAAVFPGGKVDDADVDFASHIIKQQSLILPTDEIAARLAAIRETLEETGLALGIVGAHDPHQVAEARAMAHEAISFADICAKMRWQPDILSLTPWARWRPPLLEKRVFDTRFYLINAGNVPMEAKVDATENKSLFWGSAEQALHMADKGEIKVIFPTRRNLERLAQFDVFDAANAHALDHPVEMVMTYIDERADGKWLCIPDGHGYPVTEEHLSSAMRG